MAERVVANDDVVGNRAIFGFREVAKNTFDILDRHYPEISKSLKRDRSAGLDTVLGVYNKILNNAENNTLKQLDPQTEQKKADFAIAKKNMARHFAGTQKITNFDVEKRLPEKVAAALKSLDLYDSISVSPEGRLMAPHAFDFLTLWNTAGGRNNIDTFDSQGNLKYLNSKMLTSIMQYNPTYGDVPGATQSFNRIPEIKILRSYMRNFANRARFSHDVGKIEGEYRKLSSSKILSNRIFSKLRKYGIQNNGNYNNDQALRYISPSNMINLRILGRHLIPTNIAATSKNSANILPEFRSLVNRGKLTQNGMTEMARELRLFPEELGNMYFQVKKE